MGVFATSDDLAAYMRSELDDDAADLALSLATEVIRLRLGWAVEQVVDDVITLDGAGTSILLLPTLHLTAVSSVVEDGVTLVADDDYEWSASGILERVGCAAWKRKRRGVVVTCTHGYVDLPEALVDVVLAAAGRRYGNPGGVTSETVGPFTVSYGMDLLPDEQQVIDFYRLP